MLFYRIVWWIVAKGSAVVFRARVRGQERLPKSGGYVLAPSHRSMMDITLVAVVTKEQVRFMGKAEVFRIPVLSSFFRALGGFPVERDGTDRKALRDSIEMLQAGDLLVVFPEGTRQNGTKIQPLQPGRRVPGAARRRADRAGRDRRHRGDPAQQWPALVPALRPRRDRRRRADRAAAPGRRAPCRAPRSTR